VYYLKIMETTTTKKITPKTPAKKADSKTSAAKKAPATQKSGFAIIETGGKQYKVFSGDTVKVEKLPGAHKEGAKITFDKVLLISDGKDIKIGTPYVPGAKVEAVFEGDGRNKKITVIKFKSKSRYRRKAGHRQPHTKIKIR